MGMDHTLLTHILQLVFPGSLECPQGRRSTRWEADLPVPVETCC